MNRYFLFFTLVILFAFSFEKAAGEKRQRPPAQKAESASLDKTTKPLEKETSVDKTAVPLKEKITTIASLEDEKNQELIESEIKGQEEAIEEFKVTGSRIRRIDFEGPNPVTIWTKEDLKNFGYINLSEFFQKYQPF